MKLPRGCRIVATLLLPEERRDDVLGDLTEVHRARRRELEGSPLAGLRASLRTCGEAVAILAAFAFLRLSELPWVLPRGSGAELRFGLRLIRKQPVLTATMVLALAAGMAIAATGFTVWGEIVNGELPLPDADRFVRLEPVWASTGRPAVLEDAAFAALRAAGSFEHVGATDRVVVNLLHEEGAVESVLAAWITPDSFSVLPHAPIAGRLLVASDGSQGAPPVALLRESLWRRSFDSRADVIGRDIDVSGSRVTVVGVLPDDAGFPTGGELWLAFSGEPRRGLVYFGVLRPGASIRGAREELAILGRSLSPSGADPGRGQLRVRVAGYTAPRPGEKAGATTLLLGLILLLLVIASNAANLIHARSTARRTELAIRSALGADRGRLVGQIGVEVAILAVLAAVLGLSLSAAALRRIEPRLTEAPFWMDLRPSPTVVAFVLALTVLVTLATGVVPALRATRRDPAIDLRGARSGLLGYGRVGSSLMVLEMGLSIVMLTASVVLLQGLGGPAERAGGPSAARVLTARIDIPWHLADDLPDGRARAVAAGLRALPGVREAGIASSLPGRPAADVRLGIEVADGRPGPTAWAAARWVGPGFLEVVEARLGEGRPFRIADFEDRAPPVAVVTTSFAAGLAAGRSPVGLASDSPARVRPPKGRLRGSRSSASYRTRLSAEVATIFRGSTSPGPGSRDAFTSPSRPRARRPSSLAPCGGRSPTWILGSR